MRRYLNKNSLNQPARLLAAFALSSVFLAPVKAEESSDVVELEEFAVVGRYLYTDQINALHTPTPILDVPQSLSIVLAEQMVLQGFTELGDLIAYTPGVSTSQGEGHRDSIVFRGVRTTADFFIDGVRDDVQYYRPLYNLEQVEILRGPNALFFGRGGTGGILNRVTKKGVIGETFAAYKVSADSFGAFDVQVDSNVSVSENVAVRINAFFEELSNHRDFYDGERLGVNPTAKFILSSNTVLDVSYEYADHERFIDRGIPTGSDGRPVEAFEKIVFGDSELNTTELEAHLVRAKLKHSFTDSLKGNFSVFYGDYDKMYQNFYASAYDQELKPDEVTLDGYLDTTQRENIILAGNLIGEFETVGIGHTVIVGGEYIDTSSNQDRYNAFWDTSADDTEVFSIGRPIDLKGGVGVNALGAIATNDFTTDINDDTRVDIDSYSFYIQDEIELSDMFDFILGVRYDSFDIEVFDVVKGEIRSRKDSQVSPRVGMVYKPKEALSLYWSYSESFLPRSGEQFANLNGGADDLDPDTFSNRELGLKWDLNNSLSLTVSVFEIEQSSPQVDDTDSSKLVVVDSEIQGFEAQLQGQLSDSWHVSVGYSYLYGEQVDQSGPTGLRPRELPEHMFSLWNTFKVSERLGLGLGLTYQDESFIDNGNNAALPSYLRVDAMAYYDLSDDFRVQLNVENLTDERYFPNAHSTHQVTVGAPINARISLIGRF